MSKIKSRLANISGNISNRKQFQQFIAENRALQADEDIYGGYLLTSSMLDQLLVIEQDYSIMRTIGRVLDPLVGVEEIGVPSMEAAIADAEWVSELVTSEDSTASFGKRVLHPYPMSKRIRVSRKLLRSQSNAERWVISALADAIATPQEESFIQGEGVGGPLGVLNTEDLPVYTTAASGTVTAEEIRKWIFSLPARFQARAMILTSVDFLKYVLTLQDGDGNFVFPDFFGKLLGRTVVFSDGMPDVLDSSDDPVAGEYAAVIGDFSWYWIVDVADSHIVQRLDEAYAESNQVGFNVFQETDGMAVIPNAFYALKIKA